MSPFSPGSSLLENQRKAPLEVKEYMLYQAKRRCLLALSTAVVGLLLGTGTAPARADSPAMSFATGSPGFATFFQTLGWQFTTNSPVTGDGLGYYDFGGDGLAVP